MADTNVDLNNAQTNANTNNDQAKKPDDDLVTKLVEERINESLKPIKEKLDKAYSARDEALRKIAEYEQKEKEAELKRLQEEGKHKEAYEMQLAEERAKREAIEKRNIELTRDLEVKNVLTSVEFRNDRAAEIAYKEVVTQLVQNENGAWVHRSGVSIRDFIKSFVDDDNNAFLLKPKASSGSGSTSVKPSVSSGSEKKSLFSMSQEEVLKMAREGKLRR
jgi:hypothetical protein